MGKRCGKAGWQAIIVTERLTV